MCSVKRKGIDERTTNGCYCWCDVTKPAYLELDRDAKYTMSNSTDNNTRENQFGVARGRGVEMRLATTKTRHDPDELWRVFAAHVKSLKHNSTESMA